MKGEALFRSALQRWGMELPETARQELARYLEILIEWNRKINLTGVREAGEMVDALFMESLFLSRMIPLTGKSLLDIGSGAGFPGLVLKIAEPSLDTTLLEPKERKVLFLEEVIAKIRIEKVRVIASRLEDFASIGGRNERYDLITVKALDVGSFDLPALLAREGKFVHFTVRDHSLPDERLSLEKEAPIPFSRRKAIKIYKNVFPES